jgi:hypothetical protein
MLLTATAAILEKVLSENQSHRTTSSAPILIVA